MREDDLKIRNLKSLDDVKKVQEIISKITGAVFVKADLEDQVVEFALEEDLDDLTLTTVQCELIANGWEAGEVIEGQTCAVRFRR